MYGDYTQMKPYEEYLHKAAQEYQAAQRQGKWLKQRVAHLYEWTVKMLFAGTNKTSPTADVGSAAY